MGQAEQWANDYQDECVSDDRLRALNKPYYQERLDQVIEHLRNQDDFLWEGLGPDGVEGIPGPAHMTAYYHRKNLDAQKRNESKIAQQVRQALIDGDSAEIGRIFSAQLTNYITEAAKRYVGYSADDMYLTEYVIFVNQEGLPFIGERA